jgi:hypothetical protein
MAYMTSTCPIAGFGSKVGGFRKHHTCIISTCPFAAHMCNGVCPLWSVWLLMSILFSHLTSSMHLQRAPNISLALVFRPTHLACAGERGFLPLISRPLAKKIVCVCGMTEEMLLEAQGIVGI